MFITIEREYPLRIIITYYRIYFTFYIFRADHTEVIKIDYNSDVIKLEDLLQLFWNNHEYGLSTKIKRQYMSVIFYHNDLQKEISEKSKITEIEKRKPELITTEIREATTFYPAEE